MNHQIYAINIPIYNDRLHVFFGSSDETVQAIKDSKEIPEHIADAFRESINEDIAKGLYLFNDATKYHLIWMPVVPEKVSHYATLVHELQHFVFKFLDLRGFSHTEASDEAYSYLLGFVYGEIDSLIVDLQSQKDKEEEEEEKKVKNMPPEPKDSEKTSVYIADDLNGAPVNVGDFIIFTFCEYLPQGERHFDLQGRLLRNNKTGRIYFRYHDELGHEHNRSLATLHYDPSADWQLCDPETQLKKRYKSNYPKYYV